MKRKDICKAASDYAEENSWYPGETSYESDIIAIEESFADAFKAGAEWRINSVWHDINEMPEDGRIIVLLGKYGTMLIYGPNMMYYKESVIMDGGFLKWAYKEDLMPKTDE